MEYPPDIAQDFEDGLMSRNNVCLWSVIYGCGVNNA